MTFSFSFSGELKSDVYPDQRKRSKIAREISSQFADHFGAQISGEVKAGINRMTEGFHLQCKTQGAGPEILGTMKTYLGRLLREANTRKPAPSEKPDSVATPAERRRS